MKNLSLLFLVALIILTTATEQIFSQNSQITAPFQFSILYELDIVFKCLTNFPKDFFSNPVTISSFIALPFDNSLRSIYPKSSFLSELNNFKMTHFAALTFLTAVVLYTFDPYTATTVFESFAVTSLITITTKFIVGRARPYKEESAYSFKPFNLSEEYQSFPSGHAALSWAIFTPIALKYGDFWYSVPIVISAQRLWSDNHWTSDVLFGASLGMTIGKMLYKCKEE